MAVRAQPAPTRPLHAAPAGAPRPEASDPGAERAAEARAALAALEGLVGLETVKAHARELAAFVRVQEWRAAAGVRSERVVLHMAFRGNPGTGKTTVARILGRLFHGLGLLARGHLVEVERADLVGEYVGHTAARTRAVVQRALGGVLFVDEAYSLCRGGEKDFGREATDTLVKAMEDHREEFALVLAGYGAEMDRWVRSNPGLRSRIALFLDFPDYTPDQLLRIADAMLAARQYRLAPAARARLQDMLRAPAAAGARAAGNARLVRNTLDRALRRQAARLARGVEGGGPPPTAAALAELLAEDFDISLRALAGLACPWPASAAGEAGPATAYEAHAG